MYRDITTRLLDNLSEAINKDPQAIDAISVQGSAQIIIDDGIAQIISESDSTLIDLRTHTLQSLVSAINDTSGVSAQLLTSAKLSALTLISGRYGSPCNIPIFTSFLWQIYKSVAVAMLEAIESENRALMESILNTASGTWLDEFGELFGVSRIINEPDQLYAVRIFDLSVGGRVNEYAIMNALRNIQYDAEITDSAPATFRVSVEIPSDPPNGFTYTLEQLHETVRKLKASGVTAEIVSSGDLVDDMSITDSLTFTKHTGSTKYGEGKWGQSIWG